MSLTAMGTDNPNDPDSNRNVQKRKGTFISSMNMPMVMTACITRNRIKIYIIKGFVIIFLINLDFIGIIGYYHSVLWNG